MSSNNNQNINFDINNDVIVFNTFNTKKMLSTSLNNNHNDIINGYTLTSKDIIRQINPVVIPRISTIANMAFCERATYNVSFFGMESENFSANGVIGSSIHRIVLRSLMEILESIKKNNITTSPSVSKKTKAKETFILNAERDIKINWKHFMISNIENPLPYILEDLEKRVDRLIDQIFDEEEEHKEILFRPEFTIRNIKIPLEGRLDLVKIKLTKKEKEKRIKQNQYFNCYTSTDELVNLEKESVEIIQIKTGNYQPRTAVWNLQADAEALLLMKTLNLKEPPKYTWQFSDKDGKRKKFNFEKVIKSIEKYIQIWNSKTSPQITGFCPKCSLRDGCLNWTFVNHNTLSRSKRIKRNIEFHLSKKIRDEISLDDRWKVYVVLQSPEQRQKEGSAITNLIIDPSSINLDKQQIVLVGDKSFDKFLDFSIGEHVTISDGNPNLGSNPNAVIREIDIDRKAISLEFYRDDLYYLIYDNRAKSSFTIDRFNFNSGLTSMKFLDSFFRCSSYADDIIVIK